MKIWHVTIASRYEKGVLLEHMDHSISSAMHPSMVELADYEQLRGTLSLAEEGLANYAQENGQLRSALKGLSDMYARTWDRVDGALVMMPDSIPRFEKAHAAAQEALGESLARPAVPQSAPQTDKT